MGITVIDIDSLVIKGDGEYDRWFVLKKRKKMAKVQGAVHLVITITGTGMKSHSASIGSIDDAMPFVDESLEEDNSVKEPNTVM